MNNFNHLLLSGILIRDFQSNTEKAHHDVDIENMKILIYTMKEEGKKKRIKRIQDPK
jgi:hypothetical protein